MPADDDEVSGPPPHPLDRVWFHPSELGSSVGTLRPQPASPSMWLAAIVALLIGVSGTLGIVMSVGGFSGTADRTTSASLPSPPLVDPDAVATLVTTVGRSIVTLAITQADGAEPAWIGSGVVVRESRVLTAAHVVTSGGTPSVITASGQVSPATVIGVDHETDLALLKVEGVDLVPARLATGDGLRIGKSVAALAAGPAPDRWVSAGVISGLHRLAPLAGGVQGSGLVETDAQFDSTAAGGALLDHTGAVIGILTGPDRYAVPIDVARDVVAQLDVNGTAAHGWTGIVGTDVLDRPGGGVRIRGIVDASPAQTAGLAIDDVVLTVGDIEVGNVGELVAAVRKLKPGDPVQMTIVRGSQRKVVDVTLGTSLPTPADWLVVT